MHNNIDLSIYQEASNKIKQATKQATSKQARATK
jgi:hypothetical protein